LIPAGFLRVPKQMEQMEEVNFDFPNGFFCAKDYSSIPGVPAKSSLEPSFKSTWIQRAPLGRAIGRYR